MFSFSLFHCTKEAPATASFEYVYKYIKFTSKSLGYVTIRTASSPASMSQCNTQTLTIIFAIQNGHITGACKQESTLLYTEHNTDQ